MSNFLHRLSNALSHSDLDSSPDSRRESSSSAPERYIARGSRDYKLAINPGRSDSETFSKPNQSSDNPDRRRGSSSAASAKYTVPGVRDYKLAIDPAEYQGRRASVSSIILGNAAAKALIKKTSEDFEKKDSGRRINGARDWNRIRKRGSW